MSDLSSETSGIIDRFRFLFNEFLKKSKSREFTYSTTEYNLSEYYEQNLEDLKEFLIGYLDSLYSQMKDDKSDLSKYLDETIFYKLFQETMKIYFQNYSDFKELLKDLSFILVYSIFVHFTSGDFKLYEDTIELLKKKFSDSTINLKWFDISILKKIYKELPKEEENNKFLLRSLILMINRRKNRDIQDLKLKREIF